MDATFALSDGRGLGYAEWGSPLGSPVLGFHGTSLSRLAHLGDRRPVDLIRAGRAEELMRAIRAERAESFA